MAGKARNVSQGIRTQVTLDPHLNDQLTVMAHFGKYGSNKNEVIINIIRKFIDDEFDTILNSVESRHNNTRGIIERNNIKVEG